MNPNKPRPNSRHSRSSSRPWIRLAFLVAALTTTLLVIRVNTGTRAGINAALKSLTSIPSNLIFNQPSFCEHVAPLDSSRWLARLRHPLINLGLPRPAVANALAGPLLSVYHAALQPLDIAQQMWDSTVDERAQHLSIVHARLNKSLIFKHAGPYPVRAFKGRGIVIVGGGPIYSPPAFACITFVRKTGCQLPIEVWVPPHESIPDGVLSGFEALGAAVHSLGDVYPQQMHHTLRKHVTKPAAILASSFQEVLLLDADNIPLRDPIYLFDHDLYRASGLLMWPDFWECEAKPSAWVALGIPPPLRPRGSHESGEMVIDKQRAWKPLLLALYLNLRGDVFYPMLSDTGQGDKETFALAWLSVAAESSWEPRASAPKHTSAEYGLVQYPVLALGVYKPDGKHNGFAMLQRGPEGGALFVHAHLPKADLKVDGDFVQRKWVNMTGAVSVLPVAADPADATNYLVLNAVAGYDVEKALHKVRQQLRCDPNWVQCCL